MKKKLYDTNYMKIIPIDGSINVTEVYGQGVAKCFDMGSYLSRDGSIKVHRSRWGIIQIVSNDGFIIAPFWGKPLWHDVLTTFKTRDDVVSLMDSVCNKIFDEIEYCGDEDSTLKYLNKLAQKRI